MKTNYHVSPEYAYMDIFRGIIDEYLFKVTAAAPGLLSDRAVEGLEKPFWDAVFMIAGDTLDKMKLELLSRVNPMAAYDSRLCTSRQKEDAAAELKEMLLKKERVLPEFLIRTLRSRFSLIADALSEMLGNLASHRKEVGDLLFSGQEFTCIESIEAGSGDYHNYARAAAIINTDAGKLVYKPRNCLADVRTGIFVRKYFPDSIRIPKCYTDESSFGICEFLTADPDHEIFDPDKWFYALGELTVLIQLLGSYDMHYENIISSEGLPVIIDIETILHPWMEQDTQAADDNKAVFQEEVKYSVWYSAMMPRTMDGNQLSILLRSPGAGKGASIFDHTQAFFAGLETAYTRCLSGKEELKADVSELFSDVPVRLMLRDTQSYFNLMQRAFKAEELLSEEAFTDFSEKLEEAITFDTGDDFYKNIFHSEAVSILRGDVPYFYAFGNGHDIYDADGCLGKLIMKSAVTHSLQRIERMSEKELAFERKLIEESLLSTPRMDEEQRGKSPDAAEQGLPQRTQKSLSADIAVSEAEKIILEICSRMIETPNGAAGWIGNDLKEGSPEIMQTGLFHGTTGIGVFAAAIGAADVSSEAREAAKKCEQAAIRDIEQMLEGMQKNCAESGQASGSANGQDNGSVNGQASGSATTPGSRHVDVAAMLAGNPGEASGIAGILSGLCLMNRYSGCNRYRELTEEWLEILERTDIGAVTGTDRIGGLAGIIDVLCRYPELYGTQRGKALIAAFADRLLALKNFKADGWTLWETISKRHIISGAGHGMAGIGKALYEAGRLLGSSACMEAALEALRYEEQVYNEKLGTWPDNRTWPAQKYMHGYCSGAPGIGILAHRILQEQAKSQEQAPCQDHALSREQFQSQEQELHQHQALSQHYEQGISEACGKCDRMAENAVNRLPLLFRDHLCCGNSAIAEYFLATGKHEEAGRLLNSIYTRKEEKGAYTTVPFGIRIIRGMSLFYGMAGIGYEMLRYAFPDRIYSIISPEHVIQS